MISKLFGLLTSSTGLSGTTMLVLGILSLITTGYFFYSQHEIKAQAAKIAVQEVALKASQLQISNLKKDIDLIQTINSQLNDLRNISQADLENLQRVLGKLKGLPARHLQLIQNLINNASKARNRCLAIATGATVTKEDKGNRVCPSLVK